MDWPSHFTKQLSPQGQKVLDQLEALGHRQNGRPTEHLIITPETSKPGQFTARLESSGIAYVGDWDPSGLYMSEVDLSLPHFEARTKAEDPRYRWFVEHHGRRCWELDALDPNVLRARVRQEIERHIDWALWNRVVEIEQAEVESMMDFHEVWRDRLEGAGR